MNNYDPMTTQDTVAEPTSTPEAVHMYKSDRNYNINIGEIAKTYQEKGLDAIRMIAVPSVVRDQRRGDTSEDTPTLSEVGVSSISYSANFDFCQVIADTAARPINIDNVLFTNSDPAHIGINHGTGTVEIGTYFALGWKRRSDNLILIYRVAGCDLYRTSEEQPKDKDGRPARPVARLTCELSGYSARTWRAEISEIPDELAALYEATEQRIATDYPVPLYMDTIRMIGSTEASRKTADAMRGRQISQVEFYKPDVFRRKVTAEILDIRNRQYAKLPTGPNAKRKVSPLHAVETLEYDKDRDVIVVELVVSRDDDTLPAHFQTELTAENFFEDSGRQALERGLVLKCASFEKLRTELESRRESVISVHVASIR